MKASQHHHFIYLIFKPNFITTNVFLFYLCCVLRSILVHYGPLWSYPIWSIHSYLVYLVHFSPILVHNGPSVNSIHFDHIRPNLVPLHPIWPTFLFGPFCPLWSYSIHLVLLAPLWSYLVLFNPIRSTLVLFNPLWFYLVHFGLIWLVHHFGHS